MELTPNEAVDAIQFWDRTVEIIGFVQSITPRISRGRTEFFRFFLCNNTGKKVQCVVWGTDAINEIEPKVPLNRIVHIDGAFSRVPTRPEYNHGNVPFELQLFPTTIVNDVGLHEVLEDEDAHDIPEIEFEDIIHYENQMIKVFAYLKSKFVYQTFGVNKQLGTYGCGSVTNGHHKLEVRIAAFHNTLTVEKCEGVNLQGTVRSQASRIYLQLNKDSDITPVDIAPLPMREVIAGYRELKRTNDGQMGREDVDNVNNET